MNGNLDLYKKNLQALIQSGRPIVLRIPVIGGYTDGCENQKKVIELIKSYVSTWRTQRLSAWIRGRIIRNTKNHINKW